MTLDCDEILPDRLWVGRFLRGDDISRLQAMGITTVLSVQSDSDLSYCGVSVKTIQSALRNAGIEFRRTPVEDFDREQLALRLPECVASLREALAEQSARVYLHCTAGMNRAPTIAAAFLIQSRRMPSSEAYEFVTTRRNCRPYMSLLLAFESSINPPIRTSDG
jgi:protein-tyrosine phosphatase